MPPWQGFGLFLHVRQGIAFITALKTEIRVAEKPIIGRFMLVFWRFYALGTLDVSEAITLPFGRVMLFSALIRQPIQGHRRTFPPQTPPSLWQLDPERPVRARATIGCWSALAADGDIVDCFRYGFVTSARKSNRTAAF